MTTAFQLAAIDFSYAGAHRHTLAGVSAAIRSASFTAIIGPNGSGKTTLLRLLLGVLRPASGTVQFSGRGVLEWSRRELARHVGVVTQVEDMPFPITVRELVAMGRYPHLGPWRRPSRNDDLAIEQAMERCGMSEFAGRPMDRLSGGERQRARLARALAQQPDTLVLDEPTASLDVAHEMAIFELLAAFCRHDGTTVVVVTHNLNLAARYADALLILDRGHLVADGPPRAVLTREIIERTWQWPVHNYTHPGPGTDEGAPQITALSRPVEPPPELTDAS
ncbi:MAG: ABC transporter ATP-binding protein [Gemmatimonadetes bacterium]|nr:ABC transporter ATP-binding protein [Gemmatimonadota bacterium]